jgi:hypothetical protein
MRLSKNVKNLQKRITIVWNNKGICVKSDKREEIIETLKR